MDRRNTTLPAIRPITVKSESFSRRTILSFAAASAALGYLWITLENIEAQRKAADIKYIASLIESDSNLGLATLNMFIGKVYAFADRNECRSDILSAGSSVILTDLDRMSAAGESNKISDALRYADRYFSHALSCTPTNGDTWARLAMVRLALGASPTEVASLLEKSRQFAPADGATLAARISVWTVAPEPTLERAGGALDWDIALAFSRFSTSDLVEAFSQSSAALRKRLIAVANSLPPDRVQRLRRSGLSFLPEPTTAPPFALKAQ